MTALSFQCKGWVFYQTVNCDASVVVGLTAVVWHVLHVANDTWNSQEGYSFERNNLVWTASILIVIMNVRLVTLREEREGCTLSFLLPS